MNRKDSIFQYNKSWFLSLSVAFSFGYRLLALSAASPNVLMSNAFTAVILRCGFEGSLLPKKQ